MNDTTANTLPQDADWERRQKHAAFFQTQLGSIQQGAISANTASVVLITLGAVMARFSGVLPSQDWHVLLAALIGWLFLSGSFAISFSRSAVRVETTHLLEHAQLFPLARAYRLESFLLDFAGRNPRLVGKRVRADTASAQP